MRLTHFLFFFLFSVALSGQQVSLSLILLDANSHEPIEDAHLFVVNSTYGAYSDTKGQVSLSFPALVDYELLVTHIGYEPQYLESGMIADSDTLWLIPSDLALEEVVLNAKRGRQWKKRLKQLKSAFLGMGAPASHCRILNEEQLWFEEVEGNLIARSREPLQVQNDHLGYDLIFYLDKLVIDPDGAVIYKGNAQFTEQKDIDSKVVSNRDLAYKSGLPYFLQDLTKDDPDTERYALRTTDYVDGEFITLSTPTVSDMLSYDEGKGIYLLAFEEFLEITDRVTQVKEKRTELVTVNAGQQGRERLADKIVDGYGPAVSYLYKKGPFIMFDKDGYILNKAMVKEYGYWAQQKIAMTLPVDYQSAKEELVVNEDPGYKAIRQMLYGDPSEKLDALGYLDKYWDEAYVAPLLELLRMSSDDALVAEVKALLKKKISGDKVTHFYNGLQWVWERPANYSKDYFGLKAELYKYIDPKFSTYFEGRENQSAIRLDEVLWGGVVQDGIPPLRQPLMIEASEADYLKDDDLVFGLNVNGVAKAYPKRILAWHEFFVDDFNGVEIAGVYCTLCGTVIPYATTMDDERYELGTSGFLYRSNKLMYDKATQSLWNTIDGEPVIGPLVGKNIKLESFPVVTTTWKEWRNSNPKTKVLSLETGYDRDYGTGVAYQDYFSTDELMFPVPTIDTRLKNKDEVFVLRMASSSADPIAIDVNYLEKKKVINVQVKGENVLVLWTSAGIMAYENPDSIPFEFKKGKLKDGEGQEWEVGETALISGDEKLNRLPGHRIFWFAWHNMYPQTKLIK